MWSPESPAVLRHDPEPCLSGGNLTWRLEEAGGVSLPRAFLVVVF